MCGITGILAFNEIGRMHMIHLANSTSTIKHRGPDAQNTYLSQYLGLGHRRLSVIDPTPNGNQPMTDASGRYQIVYNGEIYNYRELRKGLENKGIRFKSDTDTEVLLYLFGEQGDRCLEKLNGCFAFAVYDSEKNELFLARDRFGINPLLYYSDQDKFVFGSELRALLAYNIPKELDYESLNLYLELNYVPAPYCILKGVRKLLPGEYLKVKGQSVTCNKYFRTEPLPTQPSSDQNYDQQQVSIRRLVEESVKKRLVSDVPLGAFLSGGIDSSIVVAMASQHQANLNTFSIGFQEHPYFDETRYAKLVANKFDTKHTIFDLRTRDLYQHLEDVWEHMDEPFADSSAIPTYILSKYTRKSITVALSGDGADELFGGYMKHLALQRSINGSFANTFIKGLPYLTRFFPKSRSGAISNKIRQLERFAAGLKLDPHERYWYWAGIASHKEALAVLSAEVLSNLSRSTVQERRQQLIDTLGSSPSLNDFLRTDLELVLPSDMLTKVDWMSMAHGLEVRVPFLDHNLVNYIVGLGPETKVSGGMRKRILQDAFKEILPKELYNRPKKGFEVPLLDWLRNEMHGEIENDLLSERKVLDQGLFDYTYVSSLKKQLQSNNPHDSPARIYGLLVFQNWWNKYLS